MIQVDFLDETNEIHEDQLHSIKALLNKGAEMEGLSGDIELSVTFVDNERIRSLNNEYRGKDQSTDVLSFALEEGEEIVQPEFNEDLPRMLGDIVISFPKAIEQSEQYNHSILRELGFLALHGFLHLLGYDHDSEENEAKMFSRQREILDSYGLTRS